VLDGARERGEKPCRRAFFVSFAVTAPDANRAITKGRYRPTPMRDGAATAGTVSSSGAARVAVAESGTGRTLGRVCWRWPATRSLTSGV